MRYQAKKKFGQNFLKDKEFVERIVQSIPNIHQNEQIIEIGVGLGDLSDELLKLYQVKAYEIDNDLCSFLRKKYIRALELGRLELINQDVLTIEKKEGWLHHQDYILVSNLPYYIATHIILRVLRDPYCKGFIVMTQKEVAQKFCAKSKDSDFCALSVLTQTLGSAEILFDVPAKAFEPMPKVTSSVFMVKKSANILDSGFEDFLKVAFCSPRKKLLKNLARCYKREILEDLFKKLGLMEDVRAHELLSETYHQIFRELNKKDKYDGK
ncbi:MULTISPECIES: 16S rRNA (adenine(1518)-N(6)/adenine(1519)-N(6))-dimethyltransferase RsmA [unclassified Helicobacter]|uniref:16S rRNA (adenine(1518)-N(6)/adenine(1519)-N(6))- dimethyltransferase RsmA n=1 Tax=unclassified Helicobacter TaxID=2593540 RepID=UPI000CF112C1|nr:MULTISPECIES: 16S rRNA (adenine(1518)-N(6)/adenine(1519)-N(6))-dimethyltransferase RsmA [unclassified Helicobacter]